MSREELTQALIRGAFLLYPTQFPETGSVVITNACLHRLVEFFHYRGTDEIINHYCL